MQRLDLHRSLGAVTFCATVVFAGVLVIYSRVGVGQQDRGADTLRADSAKVQADSVSSDPLPVGAERRYGTSRFRHGTRIASLVVSPDSRLAVASSGSHYRGAVRAYSLVDGRVLYDMKVAGYEIEAAAVSPDGRILVTKQGTRLHFRDPNTGEEQGVIEVAPRAGGRTLTPWVTFSPDGRLAAFSARGKAIEVCDVEGERVVQSLDNPKTVYAAAFSPDSKQLVSGGYNSKDGVYFATLWDLESGEDLRHFASGGRGFRSLAFSPDGKTIAGAGDGGVLRLWEVATGKPSHTFPADGRRIRSVAFSPDGQRIAAAGDTIRLYDVASGEPKLVIDREMGIGLSFSADGSILTAAADGAIHRWRTADGHELTPHEAADSAVAQVVSTRDGRQVLCRDEAGYATVWDRTTGEFLRSIKLAWQREIALSPDGRYLVAAVEDPMIRFRDPNQQNWIVDGARIRIYDLDTRQYVDRFAGFEGEGHNIMFTPNGRQLVTVDHRDGAVRVWNFANGELLRTLSVVRENEKAVRHAVSIAVLSPDGKTLAVGYNRTDPFGLMVAGVNIRLWDLESGKELHELKGHTNSINDLAFSPSGKQLATSGGQGNVLMWDVETGERVLEQLPGDQYADFLAFSPNGHAMVSAANDGTISVWKTGSWAKIAEVRGHRDRVSDLHFTTDGQLLSGGMDATIIAWEIPSLGR